MQLSEIDVVTALVGAAAGIIFYISAESSYRYFSARKKGIKLAHRGLSLLCKWLAKSGMNADEIDEMTLGRLKVLVGTQAFNHEELLIMRENRNG